MPPNRTSRDYSVSTPTYRNTRRYSMSLNRSASSAGGYGGLFSTWAKRIWPKNKNEDEPVHQPTTQEPAQTPSPKPKRLPQQNLASAQDTRTRDQQDQAADHVDHVDRATHFFKDRRDQSSEAEVLADCNALNNAIRDVVLSIVDDWEQASSKRDQARRTVTTSAYESEARLVWMIIGGTMFTALQRLSDTEPRSSSELQNRVTDALQATAAFVVHHLISETFCPVLSEQTNAENQRIFESITLHEPQAIALRWRALAYKHASRGVPTSHASGQHYAAPYNARVIALFQTILVLAGEDPSSPFLQRIAQSFSNHDIVTSAIQLGEKLKTNFFSTHLDTFTLKPNSVLDETTMDADEEIGDTDSSKTPLVVCTLEVGIREIVSGKSRRIEDRVEVDKGRILLKPKVLVMSVEDVDESSHAITNNMQDNARLKEASHPKGA